MKHRTTFGLCIWVTGICAVAACGDVTGSGVERISRGASALGSSGGPQACVIGTSSLRLAESVVTSGGIATDSLDLEPGATVSGGGNIDNVGGGHVLISGATLNGTVDIAGAAPSTANGELTNGGTINGTVVTGAGQQATLPTRSVTAGTVSITENSNSAARSIASGNYGAITVNGSTVTFTAGTYNLASLTINSGSTVVFNTSGGSITINVQGTITVNGGTLTAANPGEVTFYSNSSASNAVSVNAGVTTFPGTVTAPKGGVTIGSRVTVEGCVGGKNVDFEPNAQIGPIECVTVPAAGGNVSSALSYSALSTFRIESSGEVVWGGCDPVSCPNGGTCDFVRFGDAQFHSDDCFTGADVDTGQTSTDPNSPTFSTFTFPIQLFLDGAALPTTPFSVSHVYDGSASGTGGPFVFDYSDIPGDYGDNSGTLKVCIFAE